MQLTAQEIARLVVSWVVGFCVTFWGTLVAVLIFPDIMDTTVKVFLLRFTFCQAIVSLIWYLSARFFLR